MCPSLSVGEGRVPGSACLRPQIITELVWGTWMGVNDGEEMGSAAACLVGAYVRRKVSLT
jgi:hypothetical protein